MIRIPGELRGYRHAQRYKGIRAMEPQPTYEELAETIAQCVYDKIYLEVSRYYAENGELVIEKLVDNMCSSSFQIPTGVLNRLEILEPLDDLHMRNDFTCTPDAFREKIARNKSKGCSYDTLVLALIFLLTDHPNVKPVYDVLVRLDVCEPDTEPPYDKGEDWPDESNIRWAKKKAKYIKLYKDWPALLEA